MVAKQRPSHALGAPPGLTPGQLAYTSMPLLRRNASAASRDANCGEDAEAAEEEDDGADATEADRLRDRRRCRRERERDRERDLPCRRLSPPCLWCLWRLWCFLCFLCFLPCFSFFAFFAFRSRSARSATPPASPSSTNDPVPSASTARSGGAPAPPVIQAGNVAPRPRPMPPPLPGPGPDPDPDPEGATPRMLAGPPAPARMSLPSSAAAPTRPYLDPAPTALKHSCLM